MKKAAVSWFSAGIISLWLFTGTPPSCLGQIDSKPVAPVTLTSTYYEFGADFSLKNDFGSEYSKPGDKIEAVMQRNILVNGKELPKGTKVIGAILEVAHFRPAKIHKGTVVEPLQEAKVVFELTKVKLPDGSSLQGFSFHLRGVRWQASIFEQNTVRLSTPDYDGRTVNQLDASVPFKIPSGAELLVQEEDTLRPALHRLGSIEVLASIPNVDPVLYISGFSSQINTAWTKLASTIRTPLASPGIATLEFNVAQSGDLYDVRLVRSTNSRDYDLAGLKAFLQMQRLPALPSSDTSICLPLRVSFIYGTNFMPPETSLGPIVPVVVDRKIDNPLSLDNSIVVSVLIDHTGRVKDAVVVKENNNSSQKILPLVQEMHFSSFSQGVGSPLRHSIIVLPISLLEASLQTHGKSGCDGSR
jgi:hypothetical protein